jgi:transcriptional regulator with PAS, ATPase and Fis domain
VFLDEVGDLSARAQAKLLRALQEREVRRVGENRPRRIDVRVIAATNVPLVEAVRAGRFRQDLLFRLAVVRIQLPPLRDRLEDVRALATTFWTHTAAEAGKRSRLGSDALAALCRYSWPGNVRELQNVIAAIAVAAPARGQVPARLVAQQLAADASTPEPDTRLEVVRHRSERLAVARALARHGGRRTAAARELGLSRQGLAKAMRRLKLDDDVGSAGVA